MRINNLIVLFLFVFVIFFPVSGFGNNEVILKIDDSSLATKYVDAKKTMVFTEPGRQKLTIENHSKHDLDIGNIYFVGDEFTSPIVAAGFNIHGVSGFSLIKAGTSCSLVIVADPKATPSLNSEGQPILLNYKVVGEEEGKFIQFKVKSTYNDHIRFKIRNVDFSQEVSLEGQQCNEDGPGTLLCYNGDDLCFNTGDLTIINNSENKIYIKDVGLTKNGKPIGRLEYNGCSSLESGETCKVALAVDCKAKGNTDVLPIWVTYDIDSSDGVKEGLKAVAAAIIKQKKEDEDDMQVERAAISGYIMGQTINAVYSKFVGDIFVTILGEGRGSSAVTTTSLGLIMGGGYAADGYIDELMGYRGGSIADWVWGVSLQFSVALNGCWNDKDMFRCLGYSMGCGLAAAYVTNRLQEVVYSNVVHRLPEQKSFLATYWDKSKLLFNFGIMSAIRVGCKAYAGVNTHGGLGEIYTESLSALALPYASQAINFSSDLIKDSIFGRDRLLPSFSNSSTIALNYDCDKDCVCSKLDEFEEDEL